MNLSPHCRDRRTRDGNEHQHYRGFTTLLLAYAPYATMASSNALPARLSRCLVRLNGWNLVIEEAFETRPVIAQLIDRYLELENHRFTADDWATLKATKDFLYPFWEVTLHTKDKDVTLD
jgi:hypothetical protein